MLTSSNFYYMKQSELSLSFIMIGAIKMKIAKAKVEDGKIKVVKERVMNQLDLDSSCWSVQFWGLEACENCEFKNTRRCGGQSGNAKLIREKKMKIKSEAIKGR